MTIIYADISTNPADLNAAAEAKGMTTTQFVAWATNNAVEAWKRKPAPVDNLMALHNYHDTVEGFHRL